MYLAQDLTKHESEDYFAVLVVAFGAGCRKQSAAGSARHLLRYSTSKESCCSMSVMLPHHGSRQGSGSRRTSVAGNEGHMESSTFDA